MEESRKEKRQECSEERMKEERKKWKIMENKMNESNDEGKWKEL